MRGDPPSAASRGGAEPRGHADRKPFPMNRIHCLSTVDLDRIFEIDHLPAHDEKIFATAFREVAGGQGVFTARALAALGAPVTFIGTVGDDAAGDFVVASLQRVEGLDVAIDRLAGVATGSCAILVDRTGEKAIVLAPFHPELVSRLGERLSVAAGDIVTSNYFDPVRHQHIFARVRAAGALSIVDIEQTGIAVHGWEPSLALARGADIVCTNETALGAWSEREGLTGPRLERAEKFAALIAGGRGKVCVTLGAHGVLAHDGTRSLHLPAVPVRVVNSTGAGDTFLAGLAFGLARGDAFIDAAGLATRVAADFLAHGAVNPARLAL